ncbi:MAG: superinfection immunity protein [Oscillospiraceae bacterium]|nr:superinfection immunity protein [Oscillospiraceae bacterium]
MSDAAVLGGLGVFGIILLLIGLAVYFIPTIVAVKRDHPNKVAIICVNIFLGWSFLGWVVSLVWALKNPE